MIELAEGIFLFENFLSPSLCDSIVEDIKKQDWRNAGKIPGLRDIYDYKDGDKVSLIKEFSEKNLEALNQVLAIYRRFDYDDKIPPLIDKSFAFLYRFTSYRDSGEFPPHFDSVQKKQSISIISYLNEDYEGGVVNYPKQNLSVIPKRGSVLIHPSSFTYPHSSSKVTKGTKYLCLTAFDLFLNYKG